MWSKLAPQKTKVSFANNMCDIFTTSKCPVQAQKPERRLPSTVAVSILLNASMTTTDNRGDRESPCLNPHELLKKSADTCFSLNTYFKSFLKISYPPILSSKYKIQTPLFFAIIQGFQLNLGPPNFVKALNTTEHLSLLRLLHESKSKLRVSYTKSKVSSNRLVHLKQHVLVLVIRGSK